jgi:hypothetical protein
MLMRRDDVLEIDVRLILETRRRAADLHDLEARI